MKLFSMSVAFELGFGFVGARSRHVFVVLVFCTEGEADVSTDCYVLPSRILFHSDWVYP